jgi:hypothetical protein
MNSLKFAATLVLAAAGAAQAQMPAPQRLVPVEAPNGPVMASVDLGAEFPQMKGQVFRQTPDRRAQRRTPNRLRARIHPHQRRWNPTYVGQLRRRAGGVHRDFDTAGPLRGGDCPTTARPKV